MSQKRGTVAVGLSGVSLLTLALFGFAAFGTASARTDTWATARATTVNVTAGKPSEMRFTLSKSKLAAGAITFKVANKGTKPHDFKVCSKPGTSAATNSCIGKKTAVLAPGKSAALTLTLAKAGKFEYLSTVPGQAKAGMKGLVTISGATPTPTPTTTTTGPVTGDPVSGKGLFTANCASCHTLSAAGSNSTVGPALDGLKLTIAAVQTQVDKGGPGMPPFGVQLSRQQIADVAVFVSQSSQ